MIDPDAGPTERAAAPVPAAAAADGAQQEVPWLPAQQLPQPAALLAAALPTQGQGQHLPGERECPTPEGWRAGCGHADPGPLRGASGVPGPRLDPVAGSSLSPYQGPPHGVLGSTRVPQAPAQPLSLCPELLHQLLILERDSVHPVEPGPPVTLCPCQLHRGALHGHRQGLHRGVIDL